MLALLLKNRFLSWYNTLRLGEVKKRRRRILGHIGLIMVPLVIFINMLYVYKTLLIELPNGEEWLHFIFSSAMLGLFLMLLFSGLAVVIHSLFLAKDLSFLLSSPIAIRTIFQFKLIDAAITNSTLFFAVGAPFIVALGVVLHLSPFFYLFAAFTVMLFICIPVGVAAALAIALVGVLPAKKVKNIATVVFSLLSVLLWIGLQYVRPERIHPNSPFHSPDYFHYLQQKGAAYTAYMPSQWLSDALFAFASSDFARMAIDTSRLIALCLLLYVTATALLKKAARQVLFSGTFSSGRPTSHEIPGSPHSSDRKSLNHSLFYSLWLKDLKLLLRDSRYSMQIFLYAVIMIVFPLIGSSREVETTGRLQPYFPYLYLFLFAALLSGSWASRLIPAEGQTFSYLLCSPQRRRLFLLGKISVSSSVTLVCGLVALLVMHFLQPIEAAIAGQLFIALLAITLGAGGVGILLGTYFANFKWDHPKRMLSGGGNVIFMISILLLLGLYAAVVLLSSALFSIELTLILLLMVASSLTFCGTVLSEKKLEKLDWLY